MLCFHEGALSPQAQGLSCTESQFHDGPVRAQGAPSLGFRLRNHTIIKLIMRTDFWLSAGTTQKPVLLPRAPVYQHFPRRLASPGHGRSPQQEAGAGSLNLGASRVPAANFLCLAQRQFSPDPAPALHPVSQPALPAHGTSTTSPCGSGSEDQANPFSSMMASWRPSDSAGTAQP